MLRALGHTDLTRYHNETGPRALLTLSGSAEERKGGRESIRGEDSKSPQPSACFQPRTTPVPAGTPISDEFLLLTRAFPERQVFWI